MARPPMYRPEGTEVPRSGETVELRIHGVGGATPEELLGVPVTERVGGDPAAGFFRPWLDLGRRPQLEGYSWGGLTSASRLRALWVLLSPFALANLAGWMVRHGGTATDPRRRVRTPLDSVLAAVVRLFGLVLSVAVVDYLAVGGIDLIAYQCGGRIGCTEGRWWLSPWDNGLVSGHLGRTLVVGAAVPWAAVLLVAWLTRRSQLAAHDRERVDYSRVSDPVFELNLKQREMWASPHVAHRLGLIHTAAAVTATSITLAAVAERAGVVSLPWLEMVLVATIAVAALAVLRLEGVTSRFHIFLLAWSAFLAVVTSVVVWVGEGAWSVAGPAPGSWRVGEFLLPSYPMLALVLGVLAWWSWRGERSGQLRTALMPPALLLGSVATVNAFGSGLMIRLADLLGAPFAVSAFPSDEAMAQAPIVYSDAVSDVAVTTLVTMVVLALVGMWIWTRIGKGPDCEELSERFIDRGGLDCAVEADRDWAARVSRAEATSTLTEQSPVLIGVAVALVLVGIVGVVVASGDTDGMGLGSWADRLAQPSSVVLGLVPLIGVFAVSRLYQSRSIRRVVGIVWDVATFWPRWFHPWSPPGYGERVVPQLGSRLALLTGRGSVLLSAHSQGSVLAVATLTLASDQTVDRTALLTHGSPLTRLYVRYFPEYWSADLYHEVALRVAGWRNLWRRTDFIGGEVEAVGPGGRGVDNVEVLDPISTVAPAPGEPRPVALRHSGYDRTPEYERAVVDTVTWLEGDD